MRERKILMAGVMTGTSGDGVDISLLSFSGGRNPDWAALASASYPFPRHLHEEITRNHRCETIDELVDLVFDWFEYKDNFEIETSIYPQALAA